MNRCDVRSYFPFPVNVDKAALLRKINFLKILIPIGLLKDFVKLIVLMWRIVRWQIDLMHFTFKMFILKCTFDHRT